MSHLHLNSLDSSKRQVANFDVNIVMNGLTGQEKQELCFPKANLEVAIKGRFSIWQRPVAPAPILGGPKWRAGEELKDNLATTPWMNAQIRKIHTRKVHYKWSRMEKRMQWLVSPDHVSGWDGVQWACSHTAMCQVCIGEDWLIALNVLHSGFYYTHIRMYLGWNWWRMSVKGCFLMYFPGTLTLLLLMRPMPLPEGWAELEASSNLQLLQTWENHMAYLLQTPYCVPLIH